MHFQSIIVHFMSNIVKCLLRIDKCFLRGEKLFDRIDDRKQSGDKFVDRIDDRKQSGDKSFLRGEEYLLRTGKIIDSIAECDDSGARLFLFKDDCMCRREKIIEFSGGCRTWRRDIPGIIAQVMLKSPVATAADGESTRSGQQEIAPQRKSQRLFDGRIHPRAAAFINSCRDNRPF